MRRLLYGIKIFLNGRFGNYSELLFPLLVMSFSILFLCWFLVIRDNAKITVERLGKGMTARVFLAEDASEDSIKRIKETINTIPQIEYIHYVSKEKAKEEFSKLFPEIASSLGKENPFPANFVVKFRGGPQNIENLVKRISMIRGVSQVVYQKEIAKTVEKISSLGQSLGTTLTIIFLLASAIIIGNLVALHISSRREEVYLLSLLGAARNFIYLPFVIFGTGFGIVGATIGYLLFKVSMVIASKPILTVLPVYNLTRMEILTVFLISGGIGLISAIISARRYCSEI